VARNCSFTNSTTLIPSAPLRTKGIATSYQAPMAPQALIDTIVVVAGITRPLPFGGRIADAIFNGNDSSLYLTNPTLGRVEIFQVANNAFVAAGIPKAGPQPRGIALWTLYTMITYVTTHVFSSAYIVYISV